MGKYRQISDLWPIPSNYQHKEKEFLWLTWRKGEAYRNRYAFLFCTHWQIWAFASYLKLKNLQKDGNITGREEICFFLFNFALANRSTVVWIGEVAYIWIGVYKRWFDAQTRNLVESIVKEANVNTSLIWLYSVALLCPLMRLHYLHISVGFALLSWLLR